MRRILAALLGAVVLVLGSAAAAVAHVTIAPDNVPRDTFTTFTFSVPNEEPSEDTVGVDVSLPSGFLLESAQAVPGWKTEIDQSPDGTPVEVHWSGGSLQPHTFGDFSMRGRVPKDPGTVSFSVVQKYETSSVSWSGAADSEHPAAVLTVSDAASTDPGTAQTGTPKVPLAPAPTSAAPASGGEDDLARSRASLALMLALAALLVPLSIVGMTVLRRRASSQR